MKDMKVLEVWTFYYASHDMTKVMAVHPPDEPPQLI